MADAGRAISVATRPSSPRVGRDLQARRAVAVGRRSRRCGGRPGTADRTCGSRGACPRRRQPCPHLGPAVRVGVTELQVRRRGAVDHVVVAARDDRAVERDERCHAASVQGRPRRSAATARRSARATRATRADGVDFVHEHRHRPSNLRLISVGAAGEPRSPAFRPTRCTLTSAYAGKYLARWVFTGTEAVAARLRTEPGRGAVLAARITRLSWRRPVGRTALSSGVTKPVCARTTCAAAATRCEAGRRWSGSVTGEPG